MDWRPSAGPFRAFRDRYVAPFGGLSYDLAPRAVGVHPEHLARVPELNDREVLVSADAVKPSPLSTRPAFRVVELNAYMRDALGASQNGVVFSVYDLDDPLASRVVERLAIGESLFLNASLDRLPGDIVRRPGSAA